MSCSLAARPDRHTVIHYNRTIKEAVVPSISWLADTLADFAFLKAAGARVTASESLETLHNHSTRFCLFALCSLRCHLQSRGFQLMWDYVALPGISGLLWRLVLMTKGTRRLIGWIASVWW